MSSLLSGGEKRELGVIMMGYGQKSFGSSENGSVESLTSTVHSNGLLTRIGSFEEAFGNSKPINYMLQMLQMLMLTTTTSKITNPTVHMHFYYILLQINYSLSPFIFYYYSSYNM